MEEEDVPKSVNPKEQFKESIEKYVSEMTSQIMKLKDLVEMEKSITALIVENKDKFAYPAELVNASLSARQQQLDKYLESIAVMEERVRISAEIKAFCLRNYDVMAKLDMFFGGGLGLNETKEYMQKIISEHNG